MLELVSVRLSENPVAAAAQRRWLAAAWAVARARTTPRAADAAVLAMAGMRNGEIAARLGIGAETVKRHIAHAMIAFGVTSSRGLALAIVGAAVSRRAELAAKGADVEPVAAPPPAV